MSRLWSCVRAAAGISLVGVVGGVGARVPSLILVLEPRAGRGDEIVDGGDPAVSGAAAQSFRVADRRVVDANGNSGGAGRGRSLMYGQRALGRQLAGAAIASSPSSRRVWCARRSNLRAIVNAARFAPRRSLSAT
ncbi:MAG: hypothetical protein QOF69_3881 [Solirubrobacteraceae bacterium]|nr:hypothetical protein [Solirubrobacteraceae bacterium]